MLEFYVAYENEGREFVAIVLASERPAILKFSSREEFIAAMNQVAPGWQVHVELEGSMSAEALEGLATCAALKVPPKQHDSIFSYGSIPYLGTG